MLRRALIGSVMMAALPRAAGAQDGAWPSRPVRMIVPFAAGGSTDLLGRVVAQHLGERLGQQVVVENRPGAGTNIGAEAVARARPDGYTLLFGAAAMSVNPSLMRSMPYDLFRDLAPVSLVNRTPLVLVVHPSVPARTPEELIAWMKAQPRGATYASAGAGTIPHLAMELFGSLAGIPLTHVPYRGGAPAIQDLIGGQILLLIESVPPLLPLIRSGQVRAIGVAEPAPLGVLPEVPTIAAAGMPGFEAAAWNAIWAPAGTPAEILRRLHRELVAVIQLPAVAQRFSDLGATPVGSAPEELDAFVRQEATRWAAVVRQSGATAD
jgi:tripartite-type tricarboxylate transporter receptor subunit TctC